MPDLDADARTVAHLAVALYRATYGPGDDLGTPADHVKDAVALLEQSREALATARNAPGAAFVAAQRAANAIDVPGGAPDAPADAL